MPVLGIQRSLPGTSFSPYYIGGQRSASYLISTLLTTPPTGAAGAISNNWQIRNDSATDYLVLWSMLVGWNGGDATFIRSLFSRLFLAQSAPTANNTALTPQPNKSDNAVVPALTANVWDGAGGGMTVVTQGDEIASSLFDKGETESKLDLVLAPGESLGGSLVGNGEAGIAGVQLHLSVVPPDALLART